MPIGEVIVGAALEITLQVLHEAIRKAKDRSSTKKCILDRLDATISRITPLVVHVDKISKRVEDSERKVIEELKRLLEKAVSLVEAYAELRRRNLHKKHRCKSRIKELEASLRWMVDVDVQVNQWLDIKKLVAKMSEMNTKLDKITCQPTDGSCFKSNDSTSTVFSQSSSSLEATDGSLEEDEEESPSNGSEPRIDIHLRWSSRKGRKDREIRFMAK
ncbi:BnaAnng11770D [Brassica napus]|uniref:BnaAnng11770D protein n=1 Tax=Brassica napus TaxID=3708 RepID=A0A024BSF4_BRANA|nr:HRb [Brassica napus]CDY52830.1 BnaAnng11770D [Brassica napus]